MEEGLMLIADLQGGGLTGFRVKRGMKKTGKD